MAPPTTIDEKTNSISMSFPAISKADDNEVVSKLTNLVNAVYSEAEADIFKPGYQRTTPDEVSSLIRKGQLAVAYLADTLEPVGCVSIKRLSPEKGQFGMLALDSVYRGSGLGRSIALFTEDYCRQNGCRIMQLELLVPTTSKHAFKERMQAWYLRLGYKIVKLESFEKDYPALAPLLVGPTEYRVFEKAL